MSDAPTHAYLTKIDHDAKQYRYYSLRIDPDLFGRWSLFREWGRLDSEGGVVRIDSFESEIEAMNRLVKVTQQKQKRG
jgi:predicted DNA-binding WGR domain protein